jgi:hypothetical protein
MGRAVIPIKRPRLVEEKEDESPRKDESSKKDELSKKSESSKKDKKETSSDKGNIKQMEYLLKELNKDIYLCIAKKSKSRELSSSKGKKPSSTGSGNI